MKTNEMKNLIEKANEMGRNAFRAGIKCVPAFDGALNEMVNNSPLYKNVPMMDAPSSVKIWKSWSKGWAAEWNKDAIASIKAN